MDNEIRKRRDLRDEYEAQTGNSSMPMRYNTEDECFTEDYTLWLEEQIIKNL